MSLMVFTGACITLSSSKAAAAVFIYGTVSTLQLYFSS